MKIISASTVRSRHGLRCPGPETLLLLLLAGSVWNCPGEAKIEAARIRTIAATLPQIPAGLGRPATDRAAWAAHTNSPELAGVMESAEKFSKQPLSALPDDLYLDYSRTGNRNRGQAVMFERNNRITALTLAECVEHRGRFVPALVETIRALCAERTWMYPAHDGKLNNFCGRTVDIDLRVAAVAWELATADYLLQDELPEEVRQLIRDNVRRRVLQPFRDMGEGRRTELGWLRVKNNWNAVCLAGVTGSALALEMNREDRAWFVAAAEYYIRNFLDGFTADGYCSEGIGYWNYGFGHFILLAESVRQATTGGVDLLADPKAAMPATFAFRDEIVNGIYPTIADCNPGARPDPDYLRYLAARMPGLRTGQTQSVSRGNEPLFKLVLFAFLEPTLPAAQPLKEAKGMQLRTWFDAGGVLICRPAPAADRAFAAVLKGGHNGEQHNHNDVGSFSVVSGRTMVLCDPGSEVYTARTFSSRRYESKILNSFGHSVPVVAGKLQRTGAEARADVLRADFSTDLDTLTLDLHSAYAVPELKKLERTFVYRRTGSGSLEVRDEVAFSKPGTFGTALITWSDWTRTNENELVFGKGAEAVRVSINTGGLAPRISSEILDEDVHTPKKPVRVSIDLASPVDHAILTMTITPEHTSKSKP